MVFATRHIPATHVAMLMNLDVIIGPLLAVAAFGEYPTLLTVIVSSSSSPCSSARRPSTRADFSTTARRRTCSASRSACARSRQGSGRLQTSSTMKC